jgi:hypothetical protein|tara:strand:+ start:2464 stop:2682 length:219 start_codon:yes stop_codon:yes gene_type:complete
MFYVLATKPLNDGTKGFRFNILGKKGLYRKRSCKSRGWLNVTEGDMKGYHMGRRSLYIHKAHTSRPLAHFAG